MGSTKEQCTDFIQQQAGYIQKSISKKPQTLFECHDSPGVPKQSLQAPEKFAKPAGIEAKKLEDEEILEMDTEVFNASSSTIKKLKKAVQLVKATPREEGSTKPNAKLVKRLTMTGTKNLYNVTPMSKDVTIASTMGIATTPWKSVRLPSIGAKETLTMKGSTNPETARRYISAVEEPSLVRLCPVEIRIFT
eukprot:1133725-Ditylum_brightwellii.AAC.2